MSFVLRPLCSLRNWYKHIQYLHMTATVAVFSFLIYKGRVLPAIRMKNLAGIINMS